MFRCPPVEVVLSIGGYSLSRIGTRPHPLVPLFAAPPHPRFLDLFGLSAGLILLTALLTVSYQALKATLANPVDSLRCE